MPAPPAAALTDRQVFINCPYDRAYKAVFDAIVFSIHDCGFQARFAAQEVGARSRLDRIIRLIDECSLSIHDLSRVELTGSRSKLPRFNMPFEAGLAYSRHRRSPDEHDLLLIDTHPHRYHQSISDASGLDIQSYTRPAQTVIGCVRRFLETRADDVPGEDYITGRYQRFRKSLKKATTKHSVTMGEVVRWDYANKLQSLMVEWIRDNK